MEEKKIEQPKEEVKTVSEQTEPENPLQVNWKNFRESRAKERQEKLEFERRAQESERQAAALRAVVESMSNKTIQNDGEETEDQRLEKKIAKALEVQRKVFEEELREKEERELPQKLRTIYPDFEQVCSQENIDYMDFHYPEISQALEEMPNGFKKYSAIYKAAKRFLPNKDHKAQAAKAEQNLMKPQSASRAGSAAPVEDTKRFLDDKRRSANWQRMQSVMRGV